MLRLVNSEHRAPKELLTAVTCTFLETIRSAGWSFLSQESAHRKRLMRIVIRCTMHDTYHAWFDDCLTIPETQCGPASAPPNYSMNGYTSRLTFLPFIIFPAVLSAKIIQGKIVPRRRRRTLSAGRSPASEDAGPAIPKAERQKIEAASQRRGRPVTDAEVVRLYKQKMGL